VEETDRWWRVNYIVNVLITLMIMTIKELSTILLFYLKTSPKGVFSSVL
jgi:hypothetical protein